MATHTVTISIEGRSISVDKPKVKMGELDDLQWRGNEGFSIEFDSPRSPFGQVLDHARAQGLNRPQVGYIAGSYKYTVISDRDKSIKLDPVIIIDPPPTGGH